MGNLVMILAHLHKERLPIERVYIFHKIVSSFTSSFRYIAHSIFSSLAHLDPREVCLKIFR